MRTLLTLVAAIGALAACHVPDKQPLSGDAGTDTGGDAGWSGTIDTMITSAPPDFSNNGQARFEFSSNAVGATFECSIDGDSPAKCSSPFLRSLGDGAHTFSVRAVLGDQQDQSPAEAVWTIDTDAPDTMITQGPPPADNSASVMFFFESTEMNVTFDCSLDGGDYAACNTGDSFGPLSDGAHSFAVRAHDRAGNVDASPAIRAWTTDTSTPDTQILAGPMGQSASQSAEFTFLSPNAGPGATFECALDSPVFVPCTSPDDLNNLAEGSHTFHVRVRSSAGTPDPSPATRTWIVDLTPPDTMITTGPNGTVAATSAAIMFTSNEMNVTYTCSLDGGAMAACTSPYSATNLPQGPHTFSVAATDAVGHTDATPATRAWTVDTMPPDIEFQQGPANGSTSGPYVTFAFTTSEGQTTCSVDSGAFAPCASPVSMNLPAGAHSFAVLAADGAGNSTTATRSWTVACAAADATGAAGQLHLDTADQTQANGVAGGAAATLGDSAMPEPSDPSFVAAARFGGGFNFGPGQHLAWPTALGPTSTLTFELWSKPSATGGPTDLIVNADGRVGLRVIGQGANQVKFLITVGAGTVTSAPVAAGAWHHVVASYAEPSLRLWVDGVRVEADNVALGMPLALDSLTVGGNTTGTLDEVWIAQAAITTDDAALARYCPL